MVGIRASGRHVCQGGVVATAAARGIAGRWQSCEDDHAASFGLAEVSWRECVLGASRPLSQLGRHLGSQEQAQPGPHGSQDQLSRPAGATWVLRSRQVGQLGPHSMTMACCTSCSICFT